MIPYSNNEVHNVELLGATANLVLAMLGEPEPSKDQVLSEVVDKMNRRASEIRESGTIKS